MKKKLAVIIKSFAAITILTFSFSATAFAAPGSSCGNDTDSNFLSFPTWYRGLDRTTDKNGNCSIDLKDADVGSTIFTIALNVVDIMLRLAGVLATGMVLYGGVRYIMSRGEPEKHKQALDTILKAAIGLVIAMVSALLVTFIVWRLSK
jgi:ABC-type Fe3+ transport system permease subunit